MAKPIQYCKVKKKKPHSFYLRGKLPYATARAALNCVKQLCIYRMQRETLEKPPDHPVMTDLFVKQTAFAKRVPFVVFHALV